MPGLVYELYAPTHRLLTKKKKRLKKNTSEVIIIFVIVVVIRGHKQHVVFIKEMFFSRARKAYRIPLCGLEYTRLIIAENNLEFWYLSLKSSECFPTGYDSEHRSDMQSIYFSCYPQNEIYPRCEKTPVLGNVKIDVFGFTLYTVFNIFRSKILWVNCNCNGVWRLKREMSGQ